MFRRYGFWLLMKQRHRDIPLYIPADINFMIYVHLLHPVAYYNCCMKLFGEPLDFIEESRFGILKQTKKFWSSDEFGKFTIEESESIIGMNLCNSAVEQTKFFFKLERDFNTSEKLKQALANYKRFMQLLKKEESIIVPTLQIDLIWYILFF